MKVRTHLALMAAAVLLPIAVFSAVAVALLLDAEREAARRSVRETVKLISQRVDQELSNAENAMKVLARAETLARREWPAFHDRALKARTTENAWVVLFDKDGHQLVNTRYPYGTPLARRSDLARNAQVLAEGKPSVSDMYLGSMAQRFVVTVDVPVPVEMGGPYVLVQAFFPEHFNGALAEVRAPPSWIVGLFDRNGLTIARSHRAAEFVGKPGNPRVIAAALAQGSGELRHPSREGLDIFDVFMRSPESGWTVAVGMPAMELEAPAMRAVAVAGFGLLLALAAGGWLAFLHGRRLAASIAQAAQGAALIGQESAVLPVPAVRLDELDALHAALTAAHGGLLAEKVARGAAEADRAALYAREQAARAVAEAQNKAKDDFLAMLGHELRNPLSAISGALAVIKLRGPSADGSARAFDVVERQASHLTRIVDDLLDVSRVMSGKIRLDRRPLDLAALVRRTLGTLQAAGRVQHHVLEVDLHEAWIDADATRIDQVVTNLLVNAFKYTPAQGRVAVAVGPQGAHAELRVRDTGVGIDPALMPYIFDTFVQGTPTLDRAEGGLGIGLALVQQLMQLHGGSVEARSDGTGQGSLFIARFPLVTPPGEAPAAAQPAAGAAAPCRVLVVDDHADSRSTLCELLLLSGYDTLQAADGFEALAQARDARPELAIVDIGLPGLNGYEVAERLRSDPATRGIRLVALTGYGQQQDRERALAAGFDAHLVKPASLEMLMKTLGPLVGRR